MNSLIYPESLFLSRICEGLARRPEGESQLENFLFSCSNTNCTNYTNNRLIGVIRVFYALQPDDNRADTAFQNRNVLVQLFSILSALRA